MLINMTLNDFLDETASGSPAPGGGSVSALVGALGAALSSMVCELSIGKEIESETRKKIQGASKISRDLITSLKEGVDRDTEVFNKVMEAFKMLKSSDEEKQKRTASIQHALMEAADEPYETALLCVDVMNVAYDMLKIGNKHAASDASVSGFLAYAALNGAIYNVKININSIKDIEYVSKMRSRVESLILEGEELLSKIKLLSAEIIG